MSRGIKGCYVFFEDENVKKYFPQQVCEAVIPRNIRLAEAPSHGKSIISYDITSSGALAYIELAREVVGFKEYLS